MGFNGALNRQGLITHVYAAQMLSFTSRHIVVTLYEGKLT